MFRSAFFVCFGSAVDMASMEYLLAWRMALTKQHLRQRSTPMSNIAQRVGYS
jgi:AraC-like DNA-binding protein